MGLPFTAIHFFIHNAFENANFSYVSTFQLIDNSLEMTTTPKETKKNFYCKSAKEQKPRKSMCIEIEESN